MLMDGLKKSIERKNSIIDPEGLRFNLSESSYNGGQYLIGRNFRRNKYGKGPIQKIQKTTIRIIEKQTESGRTITPVLKVLGNKYWYNHNEIELI